MNRNNNNRNHNPNLDFYSPEFFSDPKTPENEPETDVKPEDHTKFAPMLDERAAVGALKYSYSKLGLALAATIVLWLILSSVMIVVGASISPALAEDMTFSTLAGTLPLYVVCTPLLFLMVAELPVGNKDKKTLSLSHLITLFLIAQGLMWAGNFVGEGLMNIMGRLTGVDYYNQLNDTVQLPIWFIALLTGILAPVFEELIFRKLLLDRMAPHGEACAVLVNGILFGLFHGNFYQFFYAAALGMLLSFVSIKTGRVIYSMILHIAVNFMGGIIPAILLQRIDYERYLALDPANTAEIEAFYADYGPQMSALNLFSIAQIVMGLIGLVLLILTFKKFVSALNPSPLPLKKTAKAALLNGGVLCAVAVCALLIVANLLSY